MYHESGANMFKKCRVVIKVWNMIARSRIVWYNLIITFQVGFKGREM